MSRYWNSFDSYIDVYIMTFCGKAYDVVDGLVVQNKFDETKSSQIWKLYRV